MDADRLGSAFRAVRLRRGLRQRDVARVAAVSKATVSRIERGELVHVSIPSLMRVGAALDIRVDWALRWRGGELDRMLNAGHAAMHESAARLLARAGWQTAPEASFSIYGERGAIDILAFHPPTAALLVVELKTAIVDVQGLIGAVDRYRRLAPQIARERGWTPSAVSSWVLLRETGANHRRLATHATVLRQAYPQDGRAMRAWLRRPVGVVAALSFLPDSHDMRRIRGAGGAQRVRARPASVAAG
jgi:transcriptional regulator with XRE-family HTH domain